MRIRVPAELRHRICAHLERAYPLEGCGFLLGLDGREREVREVIEARNGSGEDRRRRFAIAPEEFLAAEARARSAGLEVLGFYHSHPDHPARPSAHDAARAWPWYSYVIVSVGGGRAAEMTSWRRAGEGGPLESEELRCEPPGAPASSRG